MDKSASGIPVEQAAAELGVPADALRLYIAALKPTDQSSASIPESQVTELKDELRSRAGALRLDDLSKTALTIEWLARAAVEAAKISEALDATVSELEKRVSKKTGDDTAAKLDPLVARIQAVETQVGEAAAHSVQMVGSLQGMLESQGHELDEVRAELSGLRSDVATLRSDIANLRLAVHGLEAKHQGLVGGLRTALISEAPEPPGKAKAGTQVPQPASTAGPKGEATKIAGNAAAKSVDGDRVVGVGKDGEKAENVPVTKPAKFRVPREIEINFLLERMGFRRLDSYAPGERADELPSDEEFAAFLSKFELGCDAEEVEMVSVQRGEFHMLQYQRVDKSSGIRGWISRGRT